MFKGSFTLANHPHRIEWFEVVVDITGTLFCGSSESVPWKRFRSAVIFVSYGFSVTLVSGSSVWCLIKQTAHAAQHSIVCSWLDKAHSVWVSQVQGYCFCTWRSDVGGWKIWAWVVSFCNMIISTLCNFSVDDLHSLNDFNVHLLCSSLI